MGERIYLAMDFGSGSGRGIAGHFDGTRVKIEEVNRFPNHFVDVSGMLLWDVFAMYHGICETAVMAETRFGSDCVRSIGIDGWGTDYGLLDRNGQLIGNCRCMRNADGSGMRAVEQKISSKELYQIVGIQNVSFNTLHQLYERKLARDPAVDAAETLLMFPDLLSYFLTGEKYAEYTVASTSMMLNPFTKQWDKKLLTSLGLPEHILPEIIFAGERVFPIRKGILKVSGNWNLVPVAAHDTASAVAAAPLEAGDMFCSSGTWSIIGMECEEPVVSNMAMIHNFSNEGAIDGRIRLIKNCMGMWAIQQCAAYWKQKGLPASWPEIVEQAGNAKPFVSFVNLEELQFYNAGDMVEKVQNYCMQTGQMVPETVGEIARCIYESMAMRYRCMAEELMLVTGKKPKAFRIIGGGSQNELLNQFVADAIQIPVVSGPTEAACIGNVLAQAAADGELDGVGQMRDVVRGSFESRLYEPKEGEAWNDAYQRYLKVCGYGLPCEQ